MIKSLKNRLSHRAKSDNANGIFILTISMVGVVLIAATSLVDIAKDGHMQSAYTGMAQHAAQTGLRQQNSIGGLTTRSIDSAVSEYLSERNGVYTETISSTATTGPFRSRCQGPKSPYKDKFKLKISLGTERMGKKEPDYPISVTYTPSESEREGQPVRKFATANGSYNYSVAKGTFSPSLDTLRGKLLASQYKTIKINATDLSDNTFLSMFGRPCEVHDITAASIAVKANETQ